MRIKYQMASNSKESSTVLRKTLRRKLSEIVSRINGRTDNLVESSDRIAESVRLVKDMADNVEESLKQILEE